MVLINKKNNSIRRCGHQSPVWLLVLLVFSTAPQAQILIEGTAAAADLNTLRNEVQILSTISQGVQLSVAECELSDSCAASVNGEELDQLINTINLRINNLSVRYTDTREPGLEDILIGYVDVREDYNALRDKLDVLPQFFGRTVGDDLGADAFIESGGVVSEEILELYEDVDEELTDDAFVTGEDASPQGP